MEPTTLSSLAGWESFYVIVGTSAAALTGLQFVVIALVAETRAAGDSRTIAAFGSPTVVHFGAVLLVASILSAPWHTLLSVAVALGVFAVAGLVYAGIVTLRARRQTSYRPVLEDWIFHAVLPLTAYAASTGAAIALPRFPEPALFVVGAAALLLMYVGIHNAWDTVTYIATGQAGRRPTDETSQEQGEGQQQSAASADVEA